MPFCLILYTYIYLRAFRLLRVLNNFLKLKAILYSFILNKKYLNKNKEKCLIKISKFYIVVYSLYFLSILLKLRLGGINAITFFKLKSLKLSYISVNSRLASPAIFRL